MALGKYVKIGGVIYPVTYEYVKIDGAIYPITTNVTKTAGVLRMIPIGDRYIFACERTSDRLYCLDTAMSEDWYKSPGLGDPNAVACDSSGNSYWACDSGVIAYDSDGSLLWTSTVITTVQTVCVDGSGDVYAGNYYGKIVKLNSSGGLEWSKTLDATWIVYSLCIDNANGLLYAGIGFGKDAVYWFNSTTGNYGAMTLSCEEDVTSVAVDVDGCVYVGEASGRIRKCNFDGYVHWVVTIPGADVHGLVVSHGGYGYCALGDAKKVRKFSLDDGAEEWTHTESACDTVQDCAVDISGNAYAAFVKAGSSAENQVKKLDKDAGTEVDSWSPYTGAKIYGVAVTPGIRAAGF